MDTNNTTPNQSEKPIIPETSIPATTPDSPIADTLATQNQYQGVLNNYKEELNPPVTETTTTTTTTPPTLPTPPAPPAPTTTTTTTTTNPDYSNPEIAQKKLEEILNTPSMPPIENSVPVGPAVDTSPKKSIFRTVFLVALFLFLAISAVIIYFFIKGPVATTPTTPAITPEVTEIVPTVVPTTAPVAATCALNDKQYKIAETFAAADGCNICSCGADLNITCTQRICPTTASAAATKAATPSAVTPTKTATATPTKAL